MSLLRFVFRRSAASISPTPFVAKASRRRILVIGGLLVGSGGVMSLCTGKRTLHADSPVLEEQQQTDQSQSALGTSSVQLAFYQYRTCPFCCKVRAFLDYYGLPYEEIEVNPLFKKEIKFSKRKAVPFIIVNDIQIFDSPVIVSVLRSSMLGSRSIKETLSCYPEILNKDRRGKEVVERGNKYNIMYGTTEDLEARQDEARWRQWVDDTLIHDLAPNIYRTLRESFRSFRYISTAGNFTAVERYGAQTVGAILMYFIGRRLKKKYNLPDDVRLSLYNHVTEWTQAIGKDRLFMGGKQPNLADLACYGVLNAMEGMDAFSDIMASTDVKPWYDRVKEQVTSHAGAK